MQKYYLFFYDLIMKTIVVSHGHTSIEVLHSLTPILLAMSEMTEWKWKLVDYRFSNLDHEKGDLLIIIRKYHDGKTPDILIAEELSKLRRNFSRIIYFDDSAASSVVLFSVFPYVDRYWKRSCLNNHNLYKNAYYGGHLYSQYYHDHYDIDDYNEYFLNPVLTDDECLDKLQIAWNIGIGAYPTSNDRMLNRYYKLVRKITTAMTILPATWPVERIISEYIKDMKVVLSAEVSMKNKTRKISARFISANYRKSIGFQRELLLSKTIGNDMFLHGAIGKRDFTIETYNVMAMLSPFGWGEICYRDYEAVLGGSYLIKPDMKHLDTWPNIYQDGMYHSLDWSLSEVEELSFLFDQTDQVEESVNRARLMYQDSLGNMVERCIRMISQVI